MKPDPAIVSVCDVEPAACCVGDSEEIDGTGLGGGGVVPPPPPQLGNVRNNATITNTGSTPRRRHDGIPITQIPSSGSIAIAIHPMRWLSFSARRRSCPSGVVVIVSMVDPEPPVTVVGLKPQVVSAGRPEQLKLVTAELNPFTGDTLIATVCGEPCVTVTCGEPGLSEKAMMVIQ